MVLISSAVQEGYTVALTISVTASFIESTSLAPLDLDEMDTAVEEVE